MGNIKGKKIIENTLNRLSSRRNAPTAGFVILLVLYVIASAIVIISARTDFDILFFGMSIPGKSFTGVFSAISQVCIIFMTLYFGKKGYFTALVLQLSQLPPLCVSIFVQKNVMSLPGVFSAILTILAITIIYLNGKQMTAYQKELRDQAVTDQLTGLPNRFACSRLVKALVEKGEKFAMVSIDINEFKGINDALGFDTGNHVLCEIASRWKAIADDGSSGTLDFITRIGGDEFVLFIRDYQSDEEIVNTIRQYEKVIFDRITVDNCDLYISASFGYAEFPKDADTRDAIFSDANAAMHEVKRTKSSNHILRFSPELMRTERTLDLERKIREALENGTFYFNLQPQFDMHHRLRGFEALARMKDTDGTAISPGEFIPVAEKVGLVDKVDGIVLRKSTAFFGELLNRTGADITLSVNISVRHLMKNDFLDEIREALTSSGVPANNLEIEITESIMIDSVDKALKCIDELKAMGIKIAIDDFGTGYSSLSYLNRFPADLLKVDKSFIDEMNTSESSRQYVSAIISMGHIMGFDVISEGVEEEEQIDTLREIGCDFIQGFVWGRPLMPDAAEKLVVESSVKS